MNNYSKNFCCHGGKFLGLLFAFQYGRGGVILFCPNMGVAPQKHDVISMTTKQYTNTKYISLKTYQLVVSIVLRYMDQTKTLSENLGYREVKIDKIFGVAYQIFSQMRQLSVSIATTSAASEWSIFSR